MRLIATTPAQTVQRTLSGVGSAAVTAGSAGMRRAGWAGAGRGGATPHPRGGGGGAGGGRGGTPPPPGGRGGVEKELVGGGVGTRGVALAPPFFVPGTV